VSVGEFESGCHARKQNGEAQDCAAKRRKIERAAEEPAAKRKIRLVVD
jgi:hypothetical protein